MLDLPSAVAIAHAQLLWGCSSQVIGNPTSPITTPDTVTLTLPSGIKQVISPQASDTSLTLLSDANKYYMRWSNVTPSVTTGGAGRYMVSRVAGTPQTGAVTGCGWTLFVVYESDSLPLKNINLWVTAEEVRFNGTGCPCETEIQVAGFCTPPFPAAPTGTVFVTALEGDARYTNDALYIFDVANDFYPLSGANNAYDNFFSSQVNQTSGTLDTRGTFGDRNHTVDPNDGRSFSLMSGARSAGTSPRCRSTTLREPRRLLEQPEATSILAPRARRRRRGRTHRRRDRRDRGRLAVPRRSLPAPYAHTVTSSARLQATSHVFFSRFPSHPPPPPPNQQHTKSREPATTSTGSNGAPPPPLL